MVAIVAESYERSMITNKSHLCSIKLHMLTYCGYCGYSRCCRLYGKYCVIYVNLHCICYTLLYSLRPMHGTKVKQSGAPKLLVAMVSHIGIPSQFYVRHQATEVPPAKTDETIFCETSFLLISQTNQAETYMLCLYHICT